MIILPFKNCYLKYIFFLSFFFQLKRLEDPFELFLAKLLYSWEAQNWQEKQTANFYQAFSWGSAALGRSIWWTAGQQIWACCIQSVFKVRVLWRKYWILVGLRRLQENQITTETVLKSKENIHRLHREGSSQRDKHRLSNKNSDCPKYPRGYKWLLHHSAEEGVQPNGEQLLSSFLGIRILSGLV